MNTRRLWISASILLLAFVLRCAYLDVKPAHFDEGVNGWFVDQMTRQGYYHYDPTNFHGPLHFYVLFVAQTLFGRDIDVLRFPIVLLSTACVGMTLAYRRYIGERAAQIAALMMAISPGMVFYGRYAIHETWLVFFLMLIPWGLAGMWRSSQKRYLWAAALGITGLILTKETYVIHLVAFALAAPCLWLYERYSPSAEWPLARCQYTDRDGRIVAGSCLLLILFFYTGGFLDWSSLPGLWETFATWTKTGMERLSGHEKEWWYWMQLLARYEWPALAGLALGLWLLVPGTSRVARYVAIYGLGAFIGYSIVAYKTPWCLISLTWPFYLVLGLALTECAARIDRWVSAAVAAGLGIVSLWSTLTLNFRNFDDESEPYVYVQTFTDVNQLLHPLRRLARQDPLNYYLRGHLILPEQYPWVWLLGDFPKVDFPNHDQLPAPLDANFLIIDDPLIDETEPKLRLEYYKLPMRIRGSSANHATLYLHTGTFGGFVPTNTPIFVPGSTPAPQGSEDTR